MLFFFLFSTCKDRENHSKIQTSFPSLGINPSATQESSPVPWLLRGGGGSIFRGTHCVPGQTHRQNRWSRALSLLPNPHRQKQKKKGSADSKWLFTWPLCCEPVKQPPVWVHASAALLHPDFLYPDYLTSPAWKVHAAGFCQECWKNAWWFVFIPRSIDEKRAGGFPGAIEALEVWTLQLEFHSTHCHLYNCLQAQNIFSSNISYLISHNIWQWIQFTAHHLQQLYFYGLNRPVGRHRA